MNVRDEIYALLKPITDSESIDIVDIEYRKEGSRWVVRVFIDKDEGVTLDDCQNISVQLGTILEVEEVIPHRYCLEVSSPGLDRPLKKIEDYIRFTHRLVRITYKGDMHKAETIVARITGVDDKGGISFADDKCEVRIPFDSIIKARLEVEIDF